MGEIFHSQLWGSISGRSEEEDATNMPSRDGATRTGWQWRGNPRGKRKRPWNKMQKCKKGSRILGFRAILNRTGHLSARFGNLHGPNTHEKGGRRVGTWNSVRRTLGTSRLWEVGPGGA